MNIKSQIKDGEYIVTTYESGHVVREIDQTGKIIPAEQEAQKPGADPMGEIKAKLDQLIKDVELIKAQTAVKI